MIRRDFFKIAGVTAIAAATSSLTSCTQRDVGTNAILSVDAPLDAVAMAALVHNGKATPRELTQDAIHKIKQTNGQINAVVTDNFERALKRADTINRYAPLAGVPFLVKDCVDYAGVRSTNGSMLTQNNIPKKSALFIDACERAGLNVIGMSNSPEFTASPSTENMLFGATKNPWDLSKSPGGSTGGGAAAIAAGYVPICHATDGGGSARMPASACGLFGYKPSRELLITGSTDGKQDFIFTHQTFMSRTVRDTAFASSLTEDHLRKGDYPRTPLGYVNTILNRKIRIGITLPNFFGQQPDLETRTAILSTASLLESLGHEVVDIANPINGEEFYRHYQSIFGSRLSALGKMVEGNTGKSLEQGKLIGWQPVGMIRDYDREFAKDPLYTVKGYAYMDKLIYQHNSEFFDGIDVWLTPVTLTQTPDSRYFDPRFNDNYQEHIEKSCAFMSYTPIQNVAGNAAISVPLYWTKTGIPIGSMLSAPRGHDSLLFELAYQLEQARPWARKKPAIFIY